MTSTDVGLVGSQSAVRRLQLDDITCTYVVDGTMAMRPERFLPAIPPTYWDERPDELDANGHVAMSTGGLLIESAGQRTLIDAGFGNVTTESTFGSVDCGALLDRLAGLGVTPEDIDTVALTHLHVDHTGWLFADNKEPVFPNADYVVAHAEWAPYARGEEPAEMPSGDRVIEPLRSHDRVRYVGDGDTVGPAVRALVTPGHSVGHTTYVVTSAAGARLIAFGDVFHVPAQIRRPGWGSAPDAEPEQVESARRQILTELQQPDTYGFGMHFGDQAFGRVIDGPCWEPVPAPAVLWP